MSREILSQNLRRIRSIQKMSQADLAKKHLKKALERDPINSEIRTHLHELLKI